MISFPLCFRIALVISFYKEVYTCLFVEFFIHLLSLNYSQGILASQMLLVASFVRFLLCQGAGTCFHVVDRFSVYL